MKISTSTRRAVDSMLDLAFYQRTSNNRVSLPSIASRQAVSVAYLEQIFAKLRRAGLVTAVRGPRGGYSLARSPKDINLADIMAAVDDQIDTTSCHGAQNCKSGKKCPTHDLWHRVNSQIHLYLAQMDIDSLVGKHSSLHQPAGRD